MENKKPSLIEEIHAQPDHIRSAMMWLSVLITIAIIGSFWFTTTKDQLALLSDPEGYANQKALALKQKEEERKQYEGDNSPLAMIYRIVFDLRANIGQFVQGDKIEIKNKKSNNIKPDANDENDARDAKPKLPLIDNYNK